MNIMRILLSECKYIAFKKDLPQNVQLRDVVRKVNGSYIYDEIKEEAIVPLNEVPKRYFSEIVYQLTKATASSTEIDTNWKKEAYPQK